MLAIVWRDIRPDMIDEPPWGGSMIVELIFTVIQQPMLMGSRSWSSSKMCGADIADYGYILEMA
jgi:hypothetical protein